MLTTLLIVLAAIGLALYLGHRMATRRAARESTGREAPHRSAIRCATPLSMAREITEFQRENGPIEDYLRRKRAARSGNPHSPR